MALNPLDTVDIDHAGGGSRTLQLFQGDCTNLSASDAVDFLVVSAFPGDYTPTSGSLIGALSAKDISVQQLATYKAADYRPNMPCWISAPITSSNPGIQFKRLLVFEPPKPCGQNAPQYIPHIFRAVHCFTGCIPATVVSPLVSTGSVGADPKDILTSLYNSIVECMKSDFNLSFMRIVSYNYQEVDMLTHCSSN